MVKEFLAQKGIEYKERDVSRDPKAAQEVVSRTGQMGVPVTIIDGQTIIGFDRTQLEQITGHQQRPSFGALVANASKITARQAAGITVGAYVGKVRADSLAERLGLSLGDIITEVNMQPITNAADLERAISRLTEGNRVAIVFIRGNQQLTSEGIL